MSFNIDFKPEDLKLGINSQKKKDVRNMLISADSICIILSRRIDDDNIASAVLLAEFLEKLNSERRVDIFSATQLPERFTDLYGVERIKTTDINSIKHDKYNLIVLLDGANLSQFYDPGKENIPDYTAIKEKVVSIDHHESNDKFTDNLILEPKSSSTVEVLYNNELLDVDTFSQEQAELAYSGIVDDTGNFRFGVNRKTFELAGRLLEKNVNISKVCHRVFFDVPLDAIKIAQYIFRNAEFDTELMTSFAFFTEREIDKLDASREFIGEGMRFYIEDISYTADKIERGFVFFKDGHRVKMSARGDNYTNTIDLSVIGRKIGGDGGGHFNAAGFSFDLREIEGLVDADSEKVRTHFVNQLKEIISDKD